MPKAVIIFYCKCGNDIHLTHLGGAKDVVCTQCSAKYEVKIKIAS